MVQMCVCSVNQGRMCMCLSCSLQNDDSRNDAPGTQDEMQMSGKTYNIVSQLKSIE